MMTVATGLIDRPKIMELFGGARRKRFLFTCLLHVDLSQVSTLVIIQ